MVWYNVLLVLHTVSHSLVVRAVADQAFAVTASFSLSSNSHTIKHKIMSISH